jgi:hypothetical protein
VVIPRFGIAPTESGGASTIRLWHDDIMPKRSSRIAKRKEFENSFKAVEEAIGAMRGKNPEAFARGRERALTDEEIRAEEVSPESRREMVEEAAAKRRSAKKE